MTPTGHRKKLTELNRHQLGTIDLSDAVSVDKMSSSERRTYLEQAEMVFANPVFKKEIATLMQAQIEFVACSSADREQDLVGRGTINGLSLLSERFNELHSQFKDMTTPEKPLTEEERMSVV